MEFMRYGRLYLLKVTLVGQSNSQLIVKQKGRQGDPGGLCYKNLIIAKSQSVFPHFNSQTKIYHFTDESRKNLSSRDG